MTIQALAELRSRKTANARKQAEPGLEALRKAVQILNQAERKAEHKIPLEASLVKRANLLLQRSPNSYVQKADYLTLLDIPERSAALRDEILTTSRQSLEKELEVFCLSRIWKNAPFGLA